MFSCTKNPSQQVIQFTTESLNPVFLKQVKKKKEKASRKITPLSSSARRPPARSHDSASARRVLQQYPMVTFYKLHYTSLRCAKCVQERSQGCARDGWKIRVLLIRVSSRSRTERLTVLSASSQTRTPRIFHLTSLRCTGDLARLAALSQTTVNQYSADC